MNLIKLMGLNARSSKKTMNHFKLMGLKALSLKQKQCSYSQPHLVNVLLLPKKIIKLIIR